MSAHPLRTAVSAGEDATSVVEGLLADFGSAGHPHVLKLTDPDAVTAPEVLSGTLHYLGYLHGGRPSVFELIAQSPSTIHTEWLLQSHTIFAHERELLTTLLIAAPPLKPSADHLRIEQAVSATRHALLTLSQSDRLGCALGAAAALVLDWTAMSAVLRMIARNLEVAIPVSESGWPPRSKTIAVIQDASSTPAGARAVIFGAQNLLSQHRHFWDIIANLSVRT